MRGLPYKVKEHLEKARDCALLAVEVYNKPAVKFKSGGYIALMVIACTSLFHAIFFRRKVKPYVRKAGNLRYETIEGDYLYWNLSECLANYFKSNTHDPIRVNLNFFIPLRNQIEHRSMPELDASIFAECQAMLLNFDEMLNKEFGEKYCIRESLSFSLQLFPSNESLSGAIKSNPRNKSVVDFINNYRSSIDPEILGSSKYAFKAYLIQVANHQSKDALPIQFIHFDKLSPEEQKNLGRFVTMIKYKEVPAPPPALLTPGAVVKEVQKRLGNPQVRYYDSTSGKYYGKKRLKFNTNLHTVLWKKYKVRPLYGAKDYKKTDTRYCVYEPMHGDYGYTYAWVDFVVEKMKDKAEYRSLYKHFNLKEV